MELSVGSKCKPDDLLCIATFDLCFTGTSAILKCDAQDEASQAKFVPQASSLLKYPALVGDVFTIVPTAAGNVDCYIGTKTLSRAYGAIGAYIDEFSKRLIVADL